MSAQDKAKNAAQKVTGKIKEVAGTMTDDETMEAEGQRDQTAGNLKDAGEKVKDAIKD